MTSRCLRRTTLAVVTSLSVFGALDASAQSSEDKSAAQTAFDLGKRLMVEGKFDEACPKFAESLRLDPGVGTMLFLADCFERTGRTASAWAEFREAEALASKQNDPRETLAHDRGNTLEAHLLKLTLLVPAPQSTTPGLKLQRDGREVGQPLWGVPVPVDPGAHRVTATAPGKKTWISDVTVSGRPGSSPPTELTVPALDDAPPDSVEATSSSPPAPVTAPPDSGAMDDPQRGRTQRLVGLSVAGLGVVGLGVGAVFGLLAESKFQDSKADGHCTGATGNQCDAIGRQARGDAIDRAGVSTVAFVVGGVLAAGGAVLYFTAPHAAKNVSVGVSPVPGSPGVELRASF